MEILDKFWVQFASSVKAIGFTDVIDMLFVAYLIYKLAHLMK